MDDRDNNILEEMKRLDQEMRNPMIQTFKKTTYWHQQAETMENLNQDALLKGMSECLLRIESSLVKIETLLQK